MDLRQAFLSSMLLLLAGGGACAFQAESSAAASPAAFAGLVGRHRSHSRSALRAAPKRFEDNVDGVLYVNDKCINCAACSNFAPTVFSRSPSDGHHIVHSQPSASDPVQLDQARAALAACPVAAIRVENTAKLSHASGGSDRLSPDDQRLADQLALSPKLNGLNLPFPRPLLPDVDTGVHFLGSHNDKSFGATPYLVRGTSHAGESVSVMVDTPKFTPASVRAVLSLIDNTDEEEEEEEEEGEGKQSNNRSKGPDYLFLTHVDDTAHHSKWREEFPHLKRIFHGGDLGRHNWLGDLTLEGVEVLLRGETDINDELEDGADNVFMAWNLDGEPIRTLSFDPERTWPDGVDGDFVILHTPGHSPGSISLLYRSSSEDGGGGGVGVLFTGDTFAYTTRDGGRMSGFPRYGNDLRRQAGVLRRLGTISNCYDVVAPGHGHLRSYLGMQAGGADVKETKTADVKEAVEELIR